MGQLLSAYYRGWADIASPANAASVDDDDEAIVVEDSDAIGVGADQTIGGKRRKQSDQEEDSPTKKRLKTVEYIYEHLFENGEGADVTIVALKKEWRLHKVYLCQAQFFKSLFGGNWKETNRDRVRLDVTDANITVKSLDVIFASFYKDEVGFEISEAVSIAAAASWLQLDSVLQRSGEYMAEHLKLSTVFCYHDAALNYGLLELQRACTAWLALNLMHYERDAHFLTQIRPNVMVTLLSSPSLLLLQGEMEIYEMLKKWIFLRLNPGLVASEEDPKMVVAAVSEFFQTLQKSATCPLSFYESTAVSEYRAVLDCLRLANMVTSSTAIDAIGQDGVLPLDRLEDACAAQWKRLMKVEDSYLLNDEDVFDVDESVFNDLSVRCGRVIRDDSPHCWRWTGYNFGFDLVLSYRHRSVAIKRNHSTQPCPYSLNRKAAKIVFYRICIYCFTEDRKTIWQFDSGFTKLSLKPDETAAVTRIPAKIPFPLTIQFRYLVAK